MFTARTESGIDGNKLIIENNEILNVGYKSRMLLENHIPGFLKCSVICVDGKDRYVYDITSKTSLYNIYGHSEMDYKMLYGLIENLASGMEAAGEYLLPVQHLILDPKYIYVENNTGRIFWCYYPGFYSTLKGGMNELAEYILQKADHKEDAAIELAYGFYKQVVKEDYTLRSLLSRRAAMTASVKNDGGKEAETEKILIRDDRELYPPDDGCAPLLPRSGKVIIAVCLSVVLLLSGLCLFAALYGGGMFSELLKLKEMQIFICLTEAMGMLLPVLIAVRWINSTKRFGKKPEREHENEGTGLYRQVCFGSDGLN